MVVERCDALTKGGTPCRGRRLPGSSWCVSHDPELQQARREGNRKGGEARSNARRAVKTWAEFGRAVGSEDLPHILRSCMVAVRDGSMLPNEATAICQLARTSMQIEGDLQLEQRIVELERAAGLMPATPLRRVI